MAYVSDFRRKLIGITLNYVHLTNINQTYNICLFKFHSNKFHLNFY